MNIAIEYVFVSLISTLKSFSLTSKILRLFVQLECFNMILKSTNGSIEIIAICRIIILHGCKTFVCILFFTRLTKALMYNCVATCYSFGIIFADHCLFIFYFITFKISFEGQLVECTKGIPVYKAKDIDIQLG